MIADEIGRIRLIDGRYTRLPPLWPQGDTLPPLRERVVRFFEFLAAEYRSLQSVDSCDRIMVTSTTFPFVSDEAFIRQCGGLHAYAAHTGRTPEVFTTAYECTGWGYLLRHLASQRAPDRATRVALQIADINMFEVARWNRSSLWGHSGFGVSSLVLEVGAGDLTLVLRQGRKDLALNGLVREVKAFAAEHRPHAVALPFFPDETAQLVRPPLSNTNLLPNLHANFGHCFGSDPWIALLQNQQIYRGSAVALVSLALSGYLAIGLIETTALEGH